MEMVLGREMAHFKSQRSEWLKHYKGQFTPCWLC